MEKVPVNLVTLVDLLNSDKLKKLCIKDKIYFLISTLRTMYFFCTFTIFAFTLSITCGEQGLWATLTLTKTPGGHPTAGTEPLPLIAVATVPLPDEMQPS